MSYNPSEPCEWKTYVDDPVERGDRYAEDWDPGPGVITRSDEGCVNPKLLLGIPGRKDEHLKLTFPPGRYTPEKWDAMVRWVASPEFDYAPLIIKEKDGRVFIYEGNHRIRAAVVARVLFLPVIIRYMAGSQRGNKLVIDPATGKQGSGWVGSTARAYLEERALLASRPDRWK